ncbi:hypothetical protein PAHAL_3G265800 [Panicum hallii]|nr:hypothetical protein PAHAL_3G265800 [Panicum hallii]
MGAPTQLFGAWQSLRHDTMSHPHSEPRFRGNARRRRTNGRTVAERECHNSQLCSAAKFRGEARVKIPKCRV